MAKVRYFQVISYKFNSKYVVVETVHTTGSRVVNMIISL